KTPPHPPHAPPTHEAPPSLSPPPTHNLAHRLYHTRAADPTRSSATHDNITARQVMVPRTRIFSLPSDLNLEDALSRVVDEQHSRIPVYDPQRGPEHIVGVLYAKD